MAGRDNGLVAAAYAPLADLEPQLADAMLEALRDEGVAAYAEPAPGRRGPSLDVTLPDRPTDRLWVDRAATDVARAVLEARLPGMRQELEATPPEAAATQELPPVRDTPATDVRRGGQPPLDEEAAWAAIVAGWDAVALPRHEAGEPRSEPPASDVAPSEPAASAAPAAQPPPRDPEEHFVPPEPPPLPSGDPVTRWAWAGLVGAPLFFVLAALLGWRVEGWTALLAVSAFVAGFVTLVARMSDRHSDDDPDDGAVV